MAWKHTADQMVDSIKTRIRVPEAQSTYTKAKILRLIDEELERHVVPKVMACRENYFLYESNVSISSSTSEYKIPVRAIGGKIKAAKWVDAQGDERRLRLIAYEDVLQYQNGDYNEPSFYFKRNSIKIVPTPNAGGDTLRMGWYIKPSAVVAEADCAKISSITVATNTVVVTSVPSSWTGEQTVDLVRGKGGFECLSIDLTVTPVSTTFTFSETLPSDLAVGDYICQAMESPFPQIPADIHSYLTLRVCKVMLEGLGFFDEATVLQKDIKEAESVFNTMLTPRSDGNPKKIRSWYGVLRR